jgi:acetylornithine deacetylase/succinyl-diaminopimelate desuccinylase-like protein
MMGGASSTQSWKSSAPPFVIVPLVNGDNNQHTFDENMRLEHYVEGIRTIIGMLR